MIGPEIEPPSRPALTRRVVWGQCRAQWPRCAKREGRNVGDVTYATPVAGSSATGCRRCSSSRCSPAASPPTASSGASATCPGWPPTRRPSPSRCCSRRGSTSRSGRRRSRPARSTTQQQRSCRTASPPPCGRTWQTPTSAGTSSARCRRSPPAPRHGRRVRDASSPPRPPSCSPWARRWRPSAPTTPSRPAWCAGTVHATWCWSVGETRCWPASRSRSPRPRRRTPPVPTSPPWPSRSRTPWAAPGGCACATTTASSMAPPTTPRGAATTSPTTSSARSPR